MTSTAGWRTGHRAGVCGVCEAALEPGLEVVSTLHDVAAADSPADVDAAAFARHDFCGTCFDGEADTGTPFSWWRFVVPAPEEKKAAFDLSMAREFLVRLLGQDDAARAPLRYLLALLLMRKRMVRVDEQFSDDRGEIMSIRVPPDETVWEMICPELDEEETEALRVQLGELFDLGDSPGTPAPPDDA